MKYIYLFAFVLVFATGALAQIDKQVNQEEFHEDLSKLIASGDLAKDDSLLMMQTAMVLKLETLNDENNPDPFEMTYAELHAHAYRHGFHFLSFLEPVVKRGEKAYYSNGMLITQDDAQILWDFIKDHQDVDYTNLQLEEVVDMAGG